LQTVKELPRGDFSET